MRVVFLGLSITSSWGNGHATTYRALVRELSRRGHRVLFLERDVPWYAATRDLPNPPGAETRLYGDLRELERRHGEEVAAADAVIVGSYVPEGATVAAWVVSTASGVTAFYDIDTPVTVKGLGEGGCAYLDRELVPRFDLYLSFTGGPLLEVLEQRFGARRALPLYCSVDPELYFPEPGRLRWDLGYLGTFSADRQPGLDQLLLEPARRWRAGRFVAAGPQYPRSVEWPPNVRRIEHLPPPRHRGFYTAQRFTLNVTRQPMRDAGWSPSVRLFEAGACGVPVLSDSWPGLEELFVPGDELLVVSSTEEVLEALRELPEDERRRLGERARQRVLEEHTAARRAALLESYLRAVPATWAGHRGAGKRVSEETAAPIAEAPASGVGPRLGR
jgi:spore maturation protein CgeB